MDELKTQLLAAYRRGDLYKELEAAQCRDSTSSAMPALIAMHNNHEIDLIACFQQLRKEAATGIPFYLNVAALNSALPRLIAPLEQVMDCVAHLCAFNPSAGPANLLLQGFAAFCAKDPLRPAEGLTRIEADLPRYADLLVAVLHAGSQFEPDKYYAEAIRLIERNDPSILCSAVLALGALAAPQLPGTVSSALTALERSAENWADEAILAAILKSAVYVERYDSSQESRVIQLIDRIMTVESDALLATATDLMTSVPSGVPIPISARHCLLDHLRRMDPKKAALLDQVDVALSRMLLGPERERAIEFIETYLGTHTELTLARFSNCMREISADLRLLGTLLTRWFLRGVHVLRDGVAYMVGSFHGKWPRLEINPAELPPRDNRALIFVARKSVAYLILAPVVAADVLISIMKQTDDEQTLEQLGILLYDPVLMCYPGSALEHVKKQVSLESGNAQRVLMAAMKTTEAYFDSLNTIQDVVTLRPSEAQREAEQRRNSRMMAESFKEAQKQSVLFSLVHRSVLLYGQGSIYHAQRPDGTTVRSETPMKAFRTSMEFPRLAQIDPVGFDYFLRTVKQEVFTT